MSILTEWVDRVHELLEQVKTLESEKTYWNCSTHGQSKKAWGCPECIVELRESHGRLKDAIRNHRWHTDRSTMGRSVLDEELYRVLELKEKEI